MVMVVFADEETAEDRLLLRRYALFFSSNSHKLNSTIYLNFLRHIFLNERRKTVLMMVQEIIVNESGVIDQQHPTFKTRLTNSP